MRLWLFVLPIFLFLATLQPTLAVTADAGPDKTAQVGQTITFDASGSSGNIVSYYWSFGDGTNATGITVTHSYNAPGTYMVTLLVIGDDGSTDTDTAIVTVTADTTPPNIQHNPVTSSPQNQNILITATITDASGIQYARVYYKNENRQNFAYVNMQQNGNSFTATIPASITANANYVYYYIETRDNSSNHNQARLPSSGNYTIQITQQDTTPPVVTLIDVNGDNTPPFYVGSSTVTINVSVNENVNWCKIGLNNPQNAQNGTQGTRSGNTFRFNLPLSDGSYTYYVVCEDLAGNRNNQTNNALDVSFTVDTQAPTGSLSFSYLGNGKLDITYSYSDDNMATVILKRGETVLVSFSTQSSGTNHYTDTGLVEGQTYTYKLILTDKAGHSSTRTESYTILQSQSGSSGQISSGGAGSAGSAYAGGGGAGGGGGGAMITEKPTTELQLTAKSEDKQSLTKHLQSNTVVEIIPKTELTEKTGIVKIKIKAESERTVTIVISKVKELPSNIPRPKNAYSIFEIKPSIEIKGKHEIVFKVAKGWLESRRFKPENVRLAKYVNNGWIELETELISQDENYAYYKAKLDSFSLFAIVVKEKEEVKHTTTAVTTITTTITVTQTTSIETPKVTEKTPESKWIPGFELPLALAVLAYLAYRRCS